MSTVYVKILSESGEVQEYPATGALDDLIGYHERVLMESADNTTLIIEEV